MSKRAFTHRLLATTIIGSTIAVSSPVLAQVAAPVEGTQPTTSSDQSVPAEEGAAIVVTGSRIARPDLEVASPVNVIQQEEIELRQANTAEELLRELPSVRPNLGPGVNNGGTGASNVDLRGIGTNRTLVLLDGRRIVPFDLGGVPDLNVIPIGLVERIDVVTGGASSVYGADAVAGVVNFITRRNFSGIDLSGNYRISQDGDAAQYRADLLIGANMDGGRGNVVLGVGYFNRDELFQDRRPFGRAAVSSGTGLPQGSPAGVPTFLFGTSLFTGNGGVFDPATGAFRQSSDPDLYNFNPLNLYQTPLERYSGYAHGYYEVSDAVEVYATGLYTRNLATILAAPSGTFFNTLALPLNNAFLPAAARAQICAATSVSAADCAAAAAAPGGPGTAGYREVNVVLPRRFVEYGPRFTPAETNTFQSQVGVRGNVTPTIRYDLFAQYGESSQIFQRVNYGSFSRVQQALRSFRNAQGQAVCSTTTNGCVPINLFGPQGSITPDQIAFFDLDALVARKVTQTQIVGAINGDLFNLTSPFAENPFGFAIGAEYRKLTARNQPDAPSQVQGEVLGAGARTPADFGQYDVKEVFAELALPLLENGFLHNVTIEAGARLSDYSTTGQSTTWKVGGIVEPVQGVRFRGTYQKAVRSPNIEELFLSPVQALGSLQQDPCQLQLPAGNPGLTALCIATGAPTGQIGFIPAPPANQINTTTAGNPNLDVERATTITAGLVFAPRQWIPGFSATVDFFDILVKDAITYPASADILNGCFSATLNPSFQNNAFCQLIRRNPTNGSLSGQAETPGVILAGSNLGRIRTRGVDLSLAYRLPLENIGIGSEGQALNFGFNGTWLDFYHFQATPNSINRDCTRFYSPGGCTNPRPEWKWNARVTYQTGPVDVSFLWNHVGSVELEPVRPTGIPNSQAAPGNTATSFNGILPQFRQIKAFNFFDMALRAEVSENFTFTFLIENLFDKQPPFLGSGVGGTSFNNGNTFPTIYDAIGRSFTAGARLRF
jgi:outer membrane receptor protein involved in Fe transport